MQFLADPRLAEFRNKKGTMQKTNLQTQACSIRTDLNSRKELKS